CFRVSQNRLDTFAADDVEQHERRAGLPLRSPRQLRHVAYSEVEIAGKDRLAEVGFLAQRPYLVAGDRLGYAVRLVTKITHRDLSMRGGVHHRGAAHVVGSFEQRPRQAARVSSFSSSLVSLWRSTKSEPSPHLRAALIGGYEGHSSVLA